MGGGGGSSSSSGGEKGEKRRPPPGRIRKECYAFTIMASYRSVLRTLDTLVVTILAFSLTVTTVTADVASDGLCSLYTFVPFSIGDNAPFQELGSVHSGMLNFGMSHAAAALMAARHFNERDTFVVPQLREFQDCPIMFDTEKSKVFNTETYTHAAIQTLTAQDEMPCAAVGAFNDIPAIDLSTMSTAFKFPFVITRSFNIRSIAPYSAPYTTQMFPDLISSAEMLRDFLIKKARTDYVAFMYGLTELGTQGKSRCLLWPGGLRP